MGEGGGFLSLLGNLRESTENGLYWSCKTGLARKWCEAKPWCIFSAKDFHTNIFDAGFTIGKFKLNIQQKFKNQYSNLLTSF